MKVIVVTGGIASGKSTVVSLLREIGGEGMQVFDCDGAVEELQNSGRISRDLVTAFGPDALNADGSVNRDMLRDIVRNDAERRSKLQAAYLENGEDIAAVPWIDEDGESDVM